MSFQSSLDCVADCPGYYPDHPTQDEANRIREELARQWGCIAREWACKAAGEKWSIREAWEPDRLPEPILALLEWPLAWRRIPFLPAFDPMGCAAWLDVWTRPDGIYLTLSCEGAGRLGVRPVGLTARRRSLAIADGNTDALGDILSGEMALMDGQWLPMLRIGESVPLFRWARDWEWEWRTNPQVIDGDPVESLDKIGPDSIPDRNCEAERSKMFRREVQRVDRIGEMIRQAAG